MLRASYNQAEYFFHAPGDDAGVGELHRRLVEESRGKQRFA